MKTTIEIADSLFAEARALAAERDTTLRARVEAGLRLAALCLQHGVTELWSADRDFGRFAGLKVVNPLV